MGLLDMLRTAVAAPAAAPVQGRAAAPFVVNLPGLLGIGSAPYRLPSVRSALGVPAVLRAVTLISNTAGALSMDGIRRGARVPPEERPALIVRPNPLTTPGAFWQKTAFWKALYGESWWWVAKRDPDGLAMSLVPVPPHEVKVEEDPADLRYPVVRWRDRRMARGDMVQTMLTPDPSNPLRGVGPLQLCGAAISVAVESQEWAASFYAEGGFPSVYLKSDYHFEDEDEPTKIKEKWASTPPNRPHVLSPGLEPGTLPVSPEGAQMLAARVHNNGEVALMFGIPGSLLEYNASGSSLTYQNVGQRFDDFVKGSLWPNYLEGTEQAMTDLLPRSWVARFDTDAFTRPDPKTRMEIHQIAIAAGIYDAAHAQVQEGLLPGSIETAPIPPSPPAAIPPPIEARAAASGEVRCAGMRRARRAGVVSLEPCGRLLAEMAAPPYRFTCPRCKAVAESAAA